MRKIALGLWIAACLLVAAGAAYAGSRWFSEPTPLGVPLPPVRTLFTVLPQERLDETSWMERKIANVFVEFMAPQPDGVPPLRWPYSSEIADYSIKHPHGSEITNMPTSDENGVITECWAVLHYDWPVAGFIYQLVPRREGERVTEFAARYQHELTASGAKLIGQHDPVELPAYCFQHFEYEEASGAEGSAQTHYIYIGPLGRRVLVFDYSCPPGRHEDARPLVGKIINSFVPGWELKKLMLKEDPDYGELAGTHIGQQEVFLQVAK